MTSPHDSLPSEWAASTTAELTFRYEQVCLQCGRTQGAVERLTHERACLIGRAGLPRCRVCGGWVQLVPGEVGSMGSPQVARTPGHPTPKWEAA